MPQLPARGLFDSRLCTLMDPVCQSPSSLPCPRQVTEPPPAMNLPGLKEGFVTCAQHGKSSINNLWLLSTKGPCQHSHSASEKEGSIYSPMLPPAVTGKAARAAHSNETTRVWLQSKVLGHRCSRVGQQASGGPFPGGLLLQCAYMCVSHSVVPDCSRPHGL